MRRYKNNESLKDLVERLVPCRAKYWTTEAHRLCDASKAGLCKMEIIGMPWWRFTKNQEARAWAYCRAAQLPALRRIHPYADYRDDRIIQRGIYARGAGRD